MVVADSSSTVRQVTDSYLGIVSVQLTAHSSQLTAQRSEIVIIDSYSESGI